MRSNCLIWAWRKYWQEKCRWRRMGRPRGIEPSISLRPSRLEPREVLGVDVPHWTVSFCADYASGAMVVQSFVPLDSSDLRWWQLPAVLLFKGRVRDGDSHWTTTQPPRG